MKLPRFVIKWFKRRIDAGYANCLIYALYMHQVHGWKIILQKTQHNKIKWLVWWHVKTKPPICPITGVDCIGEEAFEPLPEDYKDVYFPKPFFKGRVKKGRQLNDSSTEM